MRQARTRLLGCGSGLGLAIAAAICERHGGHLSIAPRKSGGLVVQVELPNSFRDRTV